MLLQYVLNDWQWVLLMSDDLIQFSEVTDPADSSVFLGCNECG